MPVGSTSKLKINAPLNESEIHESVVFAVGGPILSRLYSVTPCTPRFVGKEFLSVTTLLCANHNAQTAS
jgi:hypothetical protein